MARSNSSFEIRQSLAANLVVEPVKNEVSIQRYFDKAAMLYTQARDSDKEPYIARSYVCWKQFITFTSIELPKHRQFKLEDVKRKREWCTEASRYALERLERIVIEMDKQEDEVRDEANHLALIDEFDSIQAHETDSPLSANFVSKSEQENFLAKDLKILYPENNLSQLNHHLYSLEDLNNPRSEYPSISSIQISPVHQRLNLSIYEFEILQNIWPINKFLIPLPHRSLFCFTLNVNGGFQQYSFHRHDFQISFQSFFPHLNEHLKLSKYAMETNRCFFIHLGIAVNLHPFALQSYFRHVSTSRIQNSDPSELETEILQSCLQYAGFVDANCLNYIWPLEFHRYRVLLISGSTSPIFTVFQSPQVTGDFTDILIHSDGSHFTLLKPSSCEHGSFSIIPIILESARKSGHVVQEIVIDLSTATTTSIEGTVQASLFS